MELSLKLSLASKTARFGGTGPTPFELNWVDDLANQIIDDLGNELIFVDTPSEWIDDLGNFIVDETGNQLILAH